MACLVSCVVAGSTDLDEISRAKIRRILENRPSLRSKLAAARVESDKKIIFSVEHERISTVFTKLAKGHALYELHELCIQSPNSIDYFPLHTLTDEQREFFENPERDNVWPEVGSRSMQRIMTGQDESEGGWIVVQPSRYRYVATLNQGIEVRMVIGEYLGCCVFWLF